jgi:L,D-transpeptidase ErfK/SrfK
MDFHRLHFVRACLVVVLIASAPACRLEEPEAQMKSAELEPSLPSVEQLRARQAALKRQLIQQAPRSVYIVIDTARNKLYVKRREQTLLEAIVSTGSGTILEKPDRPGSRWIFDTPRGEFAVQSRLSNPIWVKPDWAFLEEGQTVPRNPAERIEAGILGEYALGFGKGYFIHGTLYTRLLGKNVTHGCIRLNDDDLRAVYRLTRIGTPVIIF